MTAGPARHLSIPPERADYGRSRRVADFYERARIGALFYAAGVIFIGVVGAYIREYGSLVLIWLSAFLLLWRLRVMHKPPATPATYQRWWREHWAIEKLGCVLWAVVLTGVGLVEMHPTTTFMIAIICTIAYATAVADTYALDRYQAKASITILMWPAIVCLYVSSSGLRSVMVTLAVYSVYLLLWTQRRANEYSRQIDNELDLLVSRAAIERLSRTDVLTGLANRREYVSVFDWSWHQARRGTEPLALLVADLDWFKQINDKHGHSAGDACLVHAASLLRDTFRRTNDFVARIGGEEFVVLLPGTDAAEALERAELFRVRLASEACMYSGRSISMSVSIGAGVVDFTADLTPDASFMRIDMACYRAKNGGRNRTVAV